MLKKLSFKTNSEKREFVIWTKLPDGINFFMGIKEVPLPNNAGNKMPMLMNIWGDFTDIKDNEGIFTKKEADFFIGIISMDGVNICTVEEAKKVIMESMVLDKQKKLN